MNILIVDDDPSVLTLMSAFLGHSGYDVSTANSSEDGIAAAKRDVPNLIITDIYMPGMTGFELIEELKLDSLTSDIPIMALSGAAITQEDRTHAFTVGAAAYETKPINPTRFIEKVSSLSH